MVVEKKKGMKTVWKRGGGEDRVKIISFLSCREAVTFDAACSQIFHKICPDHNRQILAGILN
jgi:hypothetical protein